ncbi:MAG TPA: alpha-L-arabinofuranosidase, partial [Polyangiaceae bacterium]
MLDLFHPSGGFRFSRPAARCAALLVAVAAVASGCGGRSKDDERTPAGKGGRSAGASGSAGTTSGGTSGSTGS